MASVNLVGLQKKYPDGTFAVRAIDLDIVDGEFLVLVGPSGCGKSTILRTIAGLETASGGEVRIGDRVVNGLEPFERDIAMVFQNYALYPHMTVFDNIAFPLQTQGLKKQDVKQRVAEVAGLLSLEQELHRRPKNLSGGQRQRVAMARALVRHPKAFLMDEPLSNLDAKLRVRIRAEITQLQKKLGVTTIYVTHDQVEAMTMGDRIAVMYQGVLQQAGSPQSLYDTPANLFVAGFIGSPAMNLFVGRIVPIGDSLTCEVAGSRIQLTADVVQRFDLRAHIGDTVAVGVRPEHVRLSDPAGSATGSVTGRVTLVETLGRECLVHMQVEAQPVRTEAVQVAVVGEGASVDDGVSFPIVGKAEMLALLDTGVAVMAGDLPSVQVVTDKLHFFDIETGVRL